MVKPVCGAGVSHVPPTVMPNVGPSIISCSLEFFRVSSSPSPVSQTFEHVDICIKLLIKKRWFDKVRIHLGMFVWRRILHELGWIESNLYSEHVAFVFKFQWRAFDACQIVLWNSSCLARIWEANFWRYKLKVQCFVMLLGFWGSRLAD